MIAALIALALLAFVAAPAPACAQPTLAAAVTDDVIAVTSDFRGARVTVFGALPDRRGRGDVVIAVRGPPETVTVLRKNRILGLWISGAPVRFVSAPSYFTLVASRDLRQIADAETRERLGLDFTAAARTDGPLPASSDPAVYRDALVRLKRAEGLYQEAPQLLKRLPGGLFKAAITLPANAPVGAYTADVYYFRDGRLIDSERQSVLVSTAGLERVVHDLAMNHSILYGMATIILALAAGWAASYMFNRT